MSDGGTQHTGWVNTERGSNPTVPAERALGFSGKYHSALTVAAGTSASFTGSQFGYGAVMVGHGAGVEDTIIDPMGGGRINGLSLTEDTIYDIAPSAVVANTGPVYVFKVQ